MASVTDFTTVAVEDGRTYHVRFIPPTQAIPVATLLAKVAGEGIAEAIMALTGDKVGALRNAVGVLVARMDVPGVLQIVTTCCAHVAYVEADGKQSPMSVPLDVMFAGRLEDLPAVLEASIRKNFAGFFRAVGSTFKRAQPSSTSPSP